MSGRNLVLQSAGVNEEDLASLLPFGRTHDVR